MRWMKRDDSLSDLTSSNANLDKLNNSEIFVHQLSAFLSTLEGIPHEYINDILIRIRSKLFKID